MLRLANRDASLSELCGISGEPLSRSGLNHRLKKLSAIAEQLRARIVGLPTIRTLAEIDVFFASARSTQSPLARGKKVISK